MTDEITWHKTHCARMDHGGCALLVGVRDNKIVKIKGDPDGYLNRGYICPKALASPERLTHPDRLRTPLKRVGARGEGRWEQIGWTEAIRTICENLDRIRREDGARSVAFCQGMPKGLEHMVLIRLANLFGSPNVVAVQDVCHAPREVTGMHTCGFYPVPDLHHGSQLVLAWGSNNTATNEEGEIGIRLWDRIRAGAKLIVVDPRKTDLASRADYWLQIRPGTDSALALAFLNVIIGEGLYDHDFVGEWAHGFDELSAHVADYTPEWAAGVTWVPPDLIRAAARAYARTRPASILWGNALEQTAGTFDALRGLVSLMAVCGNLDVPGGNVRANEPKLLGLGPFTKTELIPDKRKEMIHSHHGAIPRLMTVPPAYFRQAVLEGRPYPVRGAYVQCANPLVGYADSRRTHEALRTLDFLAVADVFMTPTAAMADIVLPAATHFEFNDLIHYGLGHGIVLACPKIVDPPHDCRPDLWTLNELGRHLTPAEYWYEDYEELVNEVLAPSGLDFAGFAARGFLAGPERYRKYESSGFKTPSGKVELVLSRAEKYKLPPLPGFNGPLVEEDPEYPLTLISSKNRFYLHSSYRWVQRLRSRSPEPVVEIHPDTAARHGIEDGDEVIIATRSGCITQIGRLTADIHPRVINAAYGWWFPEGSAEKQYDWEKANFNILTSVGRLGQEFGTPNLKGIGCRIERKAS